MRYLPCSRNMRLVRHFLHGFCRRGRRLEESQIIVVNYTAAGFSTTAFPAPGATSSKESVLRSPLLKNTQSTGPLAAYSRLVVEGKIREDEHQVTALKVLQELHGSLDGYTPRVQEDQYMGLWASVLRTVSPSRPQSNEGTPRGVYMFGGVGTGKTFMMDLFFEEAPVTSKRRVHFFEFMLDVHDRMHNCRKRGISGEIMVATVTDEILQEGWLLCFDEMQVTDIADAMVIRQLFGGLWSRGAVVVATSNRPPDGLYHNGLQRAAFLPFIDQLIERSIVHSLEESRTDYRLSRGTGAATKVFLYPDDEKTLEEFDMIWNAISEGVESVPVTLRVQGREVRVPSAVRGNRVARMTFEELCGSALGSADYVAISEAFHTIFISGVPKMTLIHLNQVRRFITLVDVLYERGVKLVCLAQAPCSELLDPGPGNHADMPDEVFSFGRTASRLTEMQGQEYLRRTWRPTENYLVQFTAEQLSDQDLYKIWEAYDVNGDDKMDRDELSFLMEDLCEAKNGHRNVPTEALDMTFEAMDMQKEGYVSKKTFMTFGRRFGLFVWWSESSTVTSNGNIQR